MTSNPANRQVHVTRRSLHRTAARSVARFAICLASLMMVFTTRVVFLSFFMHKGPIRAILYAAEVGRMLMILMQESSILTYSCAYKCVETWACQNIYSFGPRWSDEEQDEFHRDAVEFIGYAFHAQVIFWAVAKFWKWMGKHSALWRDGLGASMSAHFTSPSENAFAIGETTTFRLHILELKPLTTDWEEKYHVDFQVPDVAIPMMLSNLYATKLERLFAIPVAPFAVCGYIGPAGFFSQELSLAGKICFGVMQVMAVCITSASSMMDFLQVVWTG
ncbi:hypothetical protein B0H13DRAFT_1904908 [Mycena leptocephala]|nr:hypothetical protein B0H13DRAFT_1904908 [Mycena leptocephala]